MKHVFFIVLVTTFYITAMLMVGRGLDIVHIPRVFVLIGMGSCFASGVLIRV